jgi:hypothetical protein
MMGSRSHRPVAIGLAALLVIPVTLGIRSDSTVAGAVVGVVVVLLGGGWAGRAWLERRERAERERQPHPELD